MSAESGLDIGRRVKAKRIAAALRSLGGTADDARKLNEVDWIHADMLSVQQTGHGGPKRGKQWQAPSAVTRALVIEYLSRPDDQPRDEDIPPA
jgi:hypothetical protein